jgi:hypothetical protein
MTPQEVGEVPAPSFARITEQQPDGTWKEREMRGGAAGLKEPTAEEQQANREYWAQQRQQTDAFIARRALMKAAFNPGMDKISRDGDVDTSLRQNAFAGLANLGQISQAAAAPQPRAAADSQLARLQYDMENDRQNRQYNIARDTSSAERDVAKERRETYKQLEESWGTSLAPQVMRSLVPQLEGFGLDPITASGWLENELARLDPRVFKDSEKLSDAQKKIMERAKEQMGAQ